MLITYFTVLKLFFATTNPISTKPYNFFTKRSKKKQTDNTGLSKETQSYKIRNGWL